MPTMDQGKTQHDLVRPSESSNDVRAPPLRAVTPAPAVTASLRSRPLLLVAALATAAVALYFAIGRLPRNQPYAVMATLVLAGGVALLGTIASLLYLRTPRAFELSQPEWGASAEAQFQSGASSAAAEAGSRRGPTSAFELVEGVLRSTSWRLRGQTPGLMNRANLNLSIGITFACGGTVALAWAADHVVSSVDPTKGWVPALVVTLPRVALAIVVELFSYFFLSLYRASLAEIRYFENEVTTAELRILALRAAMECGDARTTRAVLSECARAERNFRLSKGETTVDLEREKQNGALARRTVNGVVELLSKSKVGIAS